MTMHRALVGLPPLSFDGEELVQCTCEVLLRRSLQKTLDIRGVQLAMLFLGHNLLLSQLPKGPFQRLETFAFEAVDLRLKRDVVRRPGSVLLADVLMRGLQLLCLFRKVSDDTFHLAVGVVQSSMHRLQVLTDALGQLAEHVRLQSLQSLCDSGMLRLVGNVLLHDRLVHLEISVGDIRGLAVQLRQAVQNRSVQSVERLVILGISVGEICGLALQIRQTVQDRGVLNVERLVPLTSIAGLSALLGISGGEL
mmetsp:Transcript_21999/g.61544  ORF Transcript_21999/g.61544 Transcript_21999/m.61544 type:complete len:252 (-) Transcript_21999:727-1482(-)